MWKQEYRTDLLQEYNHAVCDPSRPEGCIRCTPTKPSVCCDLDHPTLFAEYNTCIFPAPVRNVSRSHLLKYTMEQKEQDLCIVLEEWRLAKATEEYGKACVMDYGPGFILPTSVLDRIVDSAHHLKLRTIDDLRKETRWSSMALYGTEVLVIVNKFIAQPQNPPTAALTTTRAPLTIYATSRPRPLQPPNDHNTSLQVSVPESSSAIRKCSACGLPGHTSKLYSEVQNCCNV